MVFQLFSGGPVTQARQPVAVWSNHACQVALFFPWLQNSLSGGSVLPRLQKCLSGGSMKRPWLQEMHPTAKWCNKHVNQQSLASFQRPPKMSLPSVFWLSLDLGEECTLILEIKVRLRGSCWTFIFTEGPSSSQCSRIAHSET